MPLKPISQLALARLERNRTPVQVVSNRIALFSNPKRHIRGPFWSITPSNGKREQRYEDCAPYEAISACASGAMRVICAENFDLPGRAREALEQASVRIFDADMITVSDERGRGAFLRVAKAALKDLRAAS